MRLVHKFKKLVNLLISKVGYKIVSVKSLQQLKEGGKTGHNTMSAALLRLQDMNINPATVVDVGAASGKWTQLANEVWPKATYCLIEPLHENGPELDALVESDRSRFEWFPGVAGSDSGTVAFNVTKDLDGSGIYGSQDGDMRIVPVYKLDIILENKQVPIVIKLDTHGYELPILDGAIETLKSTEALIIEVYGFYVSPTAILFNKLSDHLEKLGFRLYDIVDVVRREKDLAFWQADAVYIKDNNPIFKNNRYQ